MVWDVLGTLTLESDIARPHTILSNLTLNMHLPDKYLCPITHELMVDPVICEGTHDRIIGFYWKCISA